MEAPHVPQGDPGVPPRPVDEMGEGGTGGKVYTALYGYRRGLLTTRRPGETIGCSHGHQEHRRITIKHANAAVMNIGKAARFESKYC